MDYTELKISFKTVDLVNDSVKAVLNETGFESFVDFDNGFSAYIPSVTFSKEDSLNNLNAFKLIIDSIKIISHPYQNWNKKWEESFSPIKISDDCIIRASFHKTEPVKYDVIIDPEMSFGTGHHETTQLMASELLSFEVSDKRVLDMGTGTGILAILAEQMKAKDIDAVELDQKVYENAILNGNLNNCNSINFINGSGKSIQNNEYDFLLININRNSILEEFMFYVSTMIKDSIILLSGFYNSDVSTIKEKGRSCGLKFLYSNSLNEWAILAMQKI